jgi:hypothetical protein
MFRAAHKEPHLARRSVASRAWAPFLVPLLVLAQFVCHGSLGGSDRLVLEPALPANALAEAGTFHGHPVEHSVEHPVGHSVEHSVGYSLGHSTQDDSHSHAAVTAALLLLLLGYALRALLRPSLGGADLPGAALPAYARAPRLTSRPHAPPLLQVFRL